MASISPFFYAFLSLEDGAPKHIDTSSLPRCHSKNYATFFQGINQNLVVEKVAFPGFSVTLLPCKSSPISLSIDCTSWVASMSKLCKCSSAINEIILSSLTLVIFPFWAAARAAAANGLCCRHSGQLLFNRKMPRNFTTTVDPTIASFS